ncbi:uncharacterized protein CLAFUR5_04600 [Fulvia fulva]|uniref:Glycine zipper 2TM domain-containing protein n=1 Tax=Passalora fulva TaxID=5499 RepID=A0A9Q8P7Z5_PASFU|nr:uncharacterized protein CLAFUR5_04600 [Fulvia fulva]KAK4628518.1 hypothetical protein CLAFUR0_04628 [Fulvia fulva]UJO16412.1 hypothetical protein CLAFUR5_04600 [Fulvia fulva]WPV29231.1 hypothetical protein CLAFUW7_04632 [Fulvia fulva]
MEGVVENSLEAISYLTDKHFDKGWDSYRKHVNGKKVEETYVPYRGPFTDPEKQRKESSETPSHASSSRKRDARRSPADTASRARSKSAVPRSKLITPAAAAATGTAVGATAYTAAPPGSRRRQRNSPPSPEREAYRPGTLQQESEESDRVLREYEQEIDDPKRRAESVLDTTDLNYIKESRRASVVATSILKVKDKDNRRDSAMASGYDDDYRGGGGYARDAPRPRSQPPRSRYYDDDDSDYDERSGRRYKAGSGRGYDDDRDYDRVVEETERYRGPVSSGPLVPMNRPLPAREESYRSGTEGPYGAGTVAQYGRRSDGALDRQESYVSRRTKGSRGRDRSYSRSPSRSRSRSGERGGGIQDKIQGAFDTSGRGLGVGIAGAVIGGLAGREFGQKHRQRDIILGAIVGGLGANAAENQWREYKNKKERNLEVDEERWEQKFDGRDYGRSRSNVR